MGSAHLRCCFLFNFRGRETIPMPGIFFIPLTKPFYLKKASDFLWRPLSQRGRTSLCLWLRPELCRPRCADAPGTELHRTRAQLPTARSHASPDQPQVTLLLLRKGRNSHIVYIVILLFSLLYNQKFLSLPPH